MAAANEFRFSFHCLRHCDGAHSVLQWHAVGSGKATHSVAVSHGGDGDHVPAAQHGSPDGAPLVVGPDYAICTEHTIVMPFSPVSPQLMCFGKLTACGVLLI